MTTKSKIKGWLERDEAKSATHMLVVCDMFDYSDYPVFADSIDDVEMKYEQYNDIEGMSKVMEVYNLSEDIDDQLNEFRAFNF